MGKCQMHFSKKVIQAKTCPLHPLCGSESTWHFNNTMVISLKTDTADLFATYISSMPEYIQINEVNKYSYSLFQLFSLPLDSDHGD